jgi:hypothetical protein
MTVDCQWVEKNLEALFCDGLSETDDRAARAHIENCESCRTEVRALNAVDPLIHNYFRRQLEAARGSRVVQRRRVYGLSAAAAVMAIALVLLIRTQQSGPVVAPVPAPPNNTSVASVDPPAANKPDGAAEVLRTKPSLEASASPDRRSPPPAIPPNASDFLVTDPAGYSHTLDAYRGHMVLIGVWSSGQTESIAAVERLYKTYSANPTVRFIGVSNERQARPANTTFPVLYNQGSRLFGAKPGEFVLIDENGALQLRGSLGEDLENLRRALPAK